MITFNVEKFLPHTSMYREGVCLSTDTKLTTDNMANASNLMEMDTSKSYIYNKSSVTWKELV